jgi:hypothetical protein
MERLLPADFLQLLAGGLLIFALVLYLISYCTVSRAHSVKLLAILSVTSLSIFSNNVWTYFVALFVIATAITELDFLQNLAAIIRGNKEYFDYKKETLSKEDKLNKVTQDVVEATIASQDTGGEAIFSSDDDDDTAKGSSQEEKLRDSVSDQQQIDRLDPNDMIDGEDTQASSKYDFKLNSTIIKTKIRAINNIYRLEKLALDEVQKMFSLPIERGVRFARENNRIEVDGVMANQDSGNDVLFEVKYLRSGKNFIDWVKLVSLQLHRIGRDYKYVTGKTARVILVLVLEDDVKLTTRQLSELRACTGSNYLIYSVGQLEGDVSNQ